MTLTENSFVRAIDTSNWHPGTSEISASPKIAIRTYFYLRQAVKPLHYFYLRSHSHSMYTQKLAKLEPLPSSLVCNCLHLAWPLPSPFVCMSYVDDPCRWRSLLVAICKFNFLTIPYKFNIPYLLVQPENLFLYLQSDWSGLRKPKMDKRQC